MLSKQPKQNLLFESACVELIGKGAKLKPHDFVWLHDVAKRATGEECPAFVEIPVQIGNATLWPMTIGASLWWREKASIWYADANETQVLAMAWAMAHAKDADAFTRAATKSRANYELIRWQVALSCSCTIAQLAWGVEKVVGQYDYIEINSPNEVKRPATSGADWGDIIAKLCAAYHQTPDYFLWNISEKAALEMLNKAPRPFDPAGDDIAKAEAMGEFWEVKRYLAQNRTGE